MSIQTQRPELLPEGSGYPRDTVPALGTVLDELGRADVRYCMWKSNEHLAAAMAGRTDLDVLVDPACATTFREVLERNGVKRLQPPPGAAFPGMEHFLGCDRDSGRLFHLHVHSQLVLGERFVKNYRIPLEREFVDSARALDGVPVPAPELELGVLGARALLKYRPRDAIKDALRIRTPGIKASMQVEIRWLLERTTIDEVRARFASNHGAIPAEVVAGFLEAFERDPRAGLRFFRIRGRLRTALRAHQRHGRLVATVDYVSIAWRHRRRLRRRPLEARMRPIRGGTTIALVGADGAGKSTIAAALTGWLGWKLQVRSAYLGSKEPSLASRWTYVVFRAFRRGQRAAGARRGMGSVVASPMASARDAAHAVHHLANARDRLRRYEAGLRDSRAGRIVIFDRFPLESVSRSGEHRLLDGPQVRTIQGGSTRGIVGALARAEERVYGRFALPDHLVVLEVSPEVSFERKPDHRPDVLAAKSRAASELAELAKQSPHPVDVIRVDADRPLDAVLREIEGRLWDAI